MHRNRAVRSKLPRRSGLRLKSISDRSLHVSALQILVQNPPIRADQDRMGQAFYTEAGRDLRCGPVPQITDRPGDSVLRYCVLRQFFIVIEAQSDDNEFSI